MLDNTGFAQYAKTYIDTVFRLAFSYTRNREDAEDVTQDVLLQLYRTEKAFDSEAHVKYWLLRVTINQCKMLFRSPWRRVESLEDYAETLCFEREDYSALFAAVMALDRKYRVLIYLYYYEGYSVRELAALLNVPEKTVSTRLHRARAKLKDALREEVPHDGT